MDEPFLCPACKANRTEFMQVFKLAREIRKDEETGAVAYASDEWETFVRDGKPDMEVQCRLCGYVSRERDFQRAARRDAARLPRIDGRRA